MRLVLIEAGRGKIQEYVISSVMHLHYSVTADTVGKSIEVYFLDAANKAKWDRKEVFHYMGGPTGGYSQQWTGIVLPGTYYLIIGNPGPHAVTATITVRTTPVTASPAGFGSGLTGNAPPPT